MIDVEGVALELSPEIVRTVATGLVFLLAAWWIVYALQRSWRQLLWEQGVHRWVALTTRIGPVRRRRFGWRLKGDGIVLDVWGGVFPVKSRLAIRGRETQVTDGVADLDWITEALDSGRHSSAG